MRADRKRSTTTAAARTAYVPTASVGPFPAPPMFRLRIGWEVAGRFFSNSISPAYGWSCTSGSDALDERAGAQAAAAALRHEATLLVGALELVEQRRGAPPAWHAERVAEALGAAVDVH